MSIATDCKIEHPHDAPTTTIEFTSTSIQPQIKREFYEHIHSEKDDFGGRKATSGSTKTSLRITFQISNSTDSALKQMRDFLKLIAENSEDLMRLTIEGDRGETWEMDGIIEPLSLLTTSGEPDIVTGSMSFDLMNEVSFT